MSAMEDQPLRQSRPCTTERGLGTIRLPLSVLSREESVHALPFRRANEQQHHQHQCNLNRGRSVPQPPPYTRREASPDRMSARSLLAAYDYMDSYTFDDAMDDLLATSSDDELSGSPISPHGSTAALQDQRCTAENSRSTYQNANAGAGAIFPASTSGRPPPYRTSVPPGLPPSFNSDIQDPRSEYRHRLPFSIYATQAIAEGIDLRAFAVHTWERILERQNPRVPADYALLSRDMVSLGSATDPRQEDTVAYVTEVTDDESTTDQIENVTDDRDSLQDSTDYPRSALAASQVNDSLVLLRQSGRVSPLGKRKRKATISQPKEENLSGIKWPKFLFGERVEDPESGKHSEQDKENRQSSFGRTLRKAGRRISSMVKWKKDSGYGSISTTPDMNFATNGSASLDEQEALNGGDAFVVAADESADGLDSHVKAGLFRTPRPSVIPPELSATQASTLASRMGMEKLKRGGNVHRTEEYPNGAWQSTLPHRPRTQSSSELYASQNMELLRDTVHEALEDANRSCQFSGSLLTNRFDNMLGNRNNGTDAEHASLLYQCAVAAEEEERERLYEASMRGSMTVRRGSASCLPLLSTDEQLETEVYLGSGPGTSRRTFGAEMAAIGGAVGSAFASSDTPLMI